MASSVVTPGQPTPMQDGEFVSQTQNSRTSWKFDNLEPPSPQYVTRDDVLMVQPSSITLSDVVHITARILTIDGKIVPLQRDIVPSIVFPAAITPITLVEGFLLSVTAVGSTLTDRGGTFVRAWLNRGTASIQNATSILLSDYVTALYPITWPGGVLRSCTEGTGRLIVETLANPAAGADWSLVVPVGRRWKIRCGTAKLTTSAAVANRTPLLSIQQNSTTVYSNKGNGALVASSQYTLSFANGLPQNTAGDGTQNIPVPQDIVLSGTAVGTIAVVTGNIQAADQWSLIAFLCEEWFDNV